MSDDRDDDDSFATDKRPRRRVTSDAEIDARTKRFADSFVDNPRQHEANVARFIEMLPSAAGLEELIARVTAGVKEVAAGDLRALSTLADHEMATAMMEQEIEAECRQEIEQADANAATSCSAPRPVLTELKSRDVARVGELKQRLGQAAHVKAELERADMRVSTAAAETRAVEVQLRNTAQHKDEQVQQHKQQQLQLQQRQQQDELQRRQLELQQQAERQRLEQLMLQLQRQAEQLEKRTEDARLEKEELELKNEERATEEHIKTLESEATAAFNDMKSAEAARDKELLDKQSENEHANNDDNAAAQLLQQIGQLLSQLSSLNPLTAAAQIAQLMSQIAKARSERANKQRSAAQHRQKAARHHAIAQSHEATIQSKARAFDAAQGRIANMTMHLRSIQASHSRVHARRAVLRPALAPK